MEIKTVAVRDINVITAEIHNIQTDVQEYASRAAMKIGEKLCEAKELLAHGEFLDWVKEEFGWSERRAQQLMQVYREFGGTQKNLFGPELNANTFADLSFSKLLLLVSVPESEREEFVRENNVADISVREMEKIIKDKKDAEDRALVASEALDEMNGKYAHLQQKLRESVQNGTEQRKELEKKAASARAEGFAEAKEMWEAEVNTEKLKVKEREAELKEAREETAKLRQDMAELKANPEVPEEILDKIRGQYASQLKEAEERERKAQEALQEAEKKARQSDPTVAVFKVHFENAQKELNEMRKIIGEAGEETAEKLRAAARAVMKTYTF